MVLLIFFKRILFFISSFSQERKALRLFLFLFLLFSFSSEALRVQFPDEELAEESVLPLVEPRRVILNRNVSLGKRVELGLGFGVNLDEPFYYPFYPTLLLGFHLTEVHSLNLTGSYFLPWRSASGEALKKGIEHTDDSGSSIKYFDSLKVPYPQMSLFLNYQYTPYYGKISLTKSWVMNISIYGYLGSGLLVSNQNDWFPAGNVGIGQKLYFNKWLGIRGDLGLYGYYGPALARLQLDETVQVKRYNELLPHEKKLIINFVANVGVIILI